MSVIDRPDSPCLGVCTTTYEEICRACGRHFSEVARWATMDEGEKARIWARVTLAGYPWDKKARS